MALCEGMLEMLRAERRLFVFVLRLFPPLDAVAPLNFEAQLQILRRIIPRCEGGIRLLLPWHL